MLCPKCGSTNPASVAICPRCGALVQLPMSQNFVPQETGAAMRLLVPVGRSGWAIAAGYAGLFAMIPFIAPIAIVISLLAIRDLKQNPKLHGMGRAVFGMVMGLLGTALLVIGLLAILVSAGR
jgi:hypothetical protein